MAALESKASVSLGSNVLILGKSGCGKTTLAQHLAAQDPTIKTVIFDEVLQGQVQDCNSDAQNRRNIFISQDAEQHHEASLAFVNTVLIRTDDWEWLWKLNRKLPLPAIRQDQFEQMKTTPYSFLAVDLTNRLVDVMSPCKLTQA